MSNAGHAPVMAKGRNYVLARVLLTMSTGSIALTTDTWNLVDSVGYVSGKYTINFKDDWSYISGSATVLNEADDFAKLVSPVYTKGSCSVKCIVSNNGTVQEINGAAIQVDLVLER